MILIKKTILANVAGLIIVSSIAVAKNHDKHQSLMQHESVKQKADTKAVLMQAGTDPFATLQEVINQLETNPNTDWEKANLEALRLHLVQMEDMTLNVDVVQSLIDKGFKAVVTPTTPRALKSMSTVLSAHPAQMKNETGWDMQVSENNGVFTLVVTTQNIAEVVKIRGLGYIGVMATGSHHQAHHWAMASGNNPHAKHHE